MQQPNPSPSERKRESIMSDEAIPASEDTIEARKALIDLLDLEVSRPTSIVQAIDILIDFKIADMLDAMADRVARATITPEAS